jgi:hypothetical protein
MNQLPGATVLLCISSGWGPWMTLALCNCFWFALLPATYLCSLFHHVLCLARKETYVNSWFNTPLLSLLVVGMCFTLDFVNSWSSATVCLLWSCLCIWKKNLAFLCCLCYVSHTGGLILLTITSCSYLLCPSSVSCLVLKNLVLHQVLLPGPICGRLLYDNSDNKIIPNSLLGKGLMVLHQLQAGKIQLMSLGLSWMTCISGLYLWESLVSQIFKGAL